MSAPVAARGPLAVEVAGIAFQNPVVLASGTAGYGRELDEVMDLEALGGLVTKAVSPRPRHGNRAPRVGDFAGGMINAIGLANPGLEAVRAEHLPWLDAHLRRARVLVNVVGDTVEDYATVVAGLDGTGSHAGYELNVSCPNVKHGGLEFGADPEALTELVRAARAITRRALFVKLSPTLPDIARTAATAVEAGADALTLVNTLPGLVVDVEARRPAIGFGTGGVSGDALLPIGVRATWLVRRALPTVPILGLGGVANAEDALQYVLAGADLVGVGTAALRDPRAPQRIVRDLSRWLDAHGVRALGELRGQLEWPTA
ncbi:MAG: dihydroorotate dehydrogenase [Gemmatimonadetes bacterium]|nr:dihydroorotate dehydrogenase [Gemmatimonadota bacterium]